MFSCHNKEEKECKKENQKTFKYKVYVLFRMTERQTDKTMYRNLH